MAQFPFQTGDPIPDRIDLLGFELFHWNPQRPQHGVYIEIHQHGPLEHKGVVGLGTAGSRNLAAIDLDVVARPELGLDVQQCKGRDYRMTQGLEEMGIGDVRIKKGLVTEDFPAQLILIEKDGAATGNAPINVNPVGAAISGPDLLSDGLVKSNQNRPWRKLQKTDSVGRSALAFQLQEGFVHGHILSRRHGGGV